MIDKREERIVGVVCLHCGLPTRISNNSSWGRAAEVAAAPQSQISIIRCTECGGEAPYLANEIVMMRSVPNAVSRAA
jgi:hypothetical protein